MNRPDQLVTDIKEQIYFIRGSKVMIDYQLAKLYEISTSRLIEALKRNIKRFPIDFMFQLTDEESYSLRSQSEISKNRGGRRYNPYVFSEQGVAMLSSVLNSERSILVNIEIMRTFVKLRELINSNEDLASKLNKLELKYDSQFKIVFDAIRELMKNPEIKKKPIGFGRN